LTSSTFRHLTLASKIQRYCTHGKPTGHCYSTGINIYLRVTIAGTFFCDFDLKHILRVLIFTQKWYRVDIL
jgi:hypothetical protein